MFRRIRSTLVLGFFGVFCLGIAVYIGAFSGIGWLVPVAAAIHDAIERIRLEAVIAVLFALFGFAFLVLAVRALFRSTKPKN